FGIGGGATHILVEFPYHSWPLDLAQQLGALLDLNVIPILAHPERNPDVQAAPSRLAALVAEGVLIQLTSSSGTGRRRRPAAATARALLDGGLAHMISTDCHDAASFQHGLTAACRTVGDDSLANWLTADVPEAILHGAAVPPRPHRQRRRSLFRRHL